jgi:DNA-binding transcriptional MerR regulator
MNVGELAEKFGLSRSTLLYYDKIDLLSPAGRSTANYRIYSEEDVQKLEKICMYRKTGVHLKKISQLLSSPDYSVWEERLSQLNDEMNALRVQQKMILELMENPGKGEVETLFGSNRFSAILRSLGLSDKELEQFHIRMEQTSSEEHRSFLYFLGLKGEEADNIIAKTKKAIKMAIKDRPV